MKKQLLKDFPSTDARGHYFYYDDDAGPQLMESDGIPPGLDKFNNSQLYSLVQEDELNKQILKYGIAFPVSSLVKFNSLQIENNGVRHDIKNVTVNAWMFDNITWEDSGISSQLPEEIPNTAAGYSQIDAALLKKTSGCDGTFGKYMTDQLRNQDPDATPITARFFGRGYSRRRKGRGIGEVLKENEIFKDLDSNPTYTLDVNGALANYNAQYAFTHPGDSTPEGENMIFSYVDQSIYIVIRTKGNAKRWWGTDRRRRRFSIYKIDSSVLFTGGGSGKITTLTFDKPLKIIEGGGGRGGAEKVALKVEKLEMYFDTRTGTPQTYPEGEGITLSIGNGSDVIEDYSQKEVNQIKPSVAEGLRFNRRNLFEEFKYQNPTRQVDWHLYTNNEDNDDFSSDIQRNFEPVSRVKVLGYDEYDLQAYQKDDNARKICSAPNTVELGFSVAPYVEVSGDLPFDDGSEQSWEGYTFYVVSWNDVDNNFEKPEDYLNDIPQTNSDMIKKQEENLYRFTSTPSTTTHNYSTPGIKVIKAVLFSHYTGYQNSQIIRWKFIETRIFLDIPLNQYPDFGELGGGDFVTIPWPHLAPIIGGTDENSKYKISIRNTLSSGKISEQDIIDFKFLTDAKNNDELGKSIKKVDLEQVRFFNTGKDKNGETYDIHKLLGIQDSITTDGTDFYPYTDNSYWDCRDWDIERNYCFSGETSVGQIFIDDNLDLDLKENCKLELNLGNLDGKSINDTNGNSNKGFFIGDYKIKKRQKNTKVRRDSFIKLPKKGTSDGAL